MRTLFSFLLAATLTVSLPEGALAQAPVELRMKWPVGARYVYRMDMVQAGDMTIPGQPAPMKQETNISQEFALAVLKDRPEGGQEVELEFLSQAMEMKMAGTTAMKFDSKTPVSPTSPENPAMAPMRKLIGLKLKYLTNAQGQMDKIEGVDAMLAKMTEDSPATAGMLKGMFNEEQMKQMIQSVQLPSKPVKLGESWPAKMDIPMAGMGRMTLDSTMTFKQMEQRDGRACAVLQQKGTISSSGGGAVAGGPTIEMEKGDMEGTTWFDPAVGALIETKGQQKMKMNVGAPNPGAPGEKINMAMDMNQTIGMKLIEAGKIPK